MNKFARSDCGGRAVVGALLSAVFLWGLALSVSPQFHHFVHGDANRAEHVCAATLIASGSYDHAAHPPLVTSPAPAVLFPKIPGFAEQWVESPFLRASIFEHAPPAHS
jgi:hypothetical protein